MTTPLSQPMLLAPASTLSPVPYTITTADTSLNGFDQDIIMGNAAADADKSEDMLHLDRQDSIVNNTVAPNGTRITADHVDSLECEERERHSDSSRRINDADFELPRPQLRPQRRTMPTTWIDTDNTGDYDPKEAKGRRRVKAARTRAARIRPAAPPPELIEDEVTEKSPEPAKLPVVLDFTRKQAAITELNAHDTLVAKPSARGGKLRAELTGTDQESTCSLLMDERQWPCQTCAEDGHHCELLIPPVCKRRRIGCSYTYPRAHGEFCIRCAKDGTSCVAGPNKEFIKQRIRCDRDWSAEPLQKRRKGKQKVEEDCQECGDTGRECSYPTISYGGPCEACVDRGLPCTIRSAAPVEPELELEPEPEPEPEPMPKLELWPRNDLQRIKSKQALQKKGYVAKIYTSFSHPIQFNCNEQQQQARTYTATPKCLFCTEPQAMLWGLGHKKPDVIIWHDNKPFTELRHGFKAAGVPNTQICMSCTAMRCQILFCVGHQLKRLEPNIPAKYCSLCEDVGEYGCVAKGSVGGSGCGLRLCRACAISFARDHRGSLGRMLGSITEDYQPRGDQGVRLRADCELLKENGLLARYVARMLREPSAAEMAE